MSTTRPIQMLLLLAALLATLALTPAARAAEGDPAATESAPPPPPASVTAPDLRAAAATAARGKLRSQYRLGSTGPKRFDCSGLVIFAYQQAGHTLAGRTSQELFAHGARVRRSELKRGDLVWTWDRDYGHVGIYLGNNRYVHAPGAGRRVQIAPLPRGRGFIGAIRP